MVYTRRPTTWIDATGRREMWTAERFSRASLRRPLDWHITFHPRFMHIYPEIPLADLFKDGRRRTATRLQRRGIGFYGIWARENYAGERQEHLHVALYLPDEDAAKDLEQGWRSWFPGEERMIRFTQPGTVLDPRKGWEMSKAVTYCAKQMLPAAAYHPNPALRYHRESAGKWGDPVAPVLGQKWGTTDNINPFARAAWRPQRPRRPSPSARSAAVAA
jgi:hypothetical protein